MNQYFKLSPNEPPEKHSRVELVLGLTTIATTALAAQVEGRRFWALVGIAFIALLVLVVMLLKDWFKRTKELRHDLRVARQTLPAFVKASSRLKKLIDPDCRFNDSLTYLLENDVFQRNNEESQRWGFTSPRMLSEHISLIETSPFRSKPTLEEFVNYVGRINAIINAFSRYCVSPVFEAWPQKGPSLDARALSRIESFRERWVAFLDSYVELNESVTSRFMKPRLSQRYFQRPDPVANYAHLQGS
jgi:hypothetical protein